MALHFGLAQLLVAQRVHARHYLHRLVLLFPRNHVAPGSSERIDCATQNAVVIRRKVSAVNLDGVDMEKAMVNAAQEGIFNEHSETAPAERGPHLGRGHPLKKQFGSIHAS